LFTVLLLPSLSRAQISGAIASDTTWTGTVIADSVYIPSGRILTVQPGTIVKFNAGKMLVVAGKLLANGTSGSKITFTSNAGTPAAGNWNGIELQNSADVNSVLNYCIVEYAGGGSNGANIFYKTGAPNINITNSIIRLSSNNGINPRSASPRISTTTLRQNAGYGFYADLSLSFVIDSCIVSGNTAGGILIGVNSTATVTSSVVDSNGTGIFIGNSASPTVQKNNIRRNNVGIQFTGVGATQPTIKQDTIANNTTWGFLNTSATTTVLARQNYWGSDTGPFHSTLNPTGLGDKISNNVDFQPWSTLAAPLAVTQIAANTTLGTATTWASGVMWLKGNVTVSSGVVLTINPGVIVKFAPGARLTVNGSIVASGASGNLIVFTSEKDDSYGGDSNGDGTVTIAGRGDWADVFLSSGQNNTSILNYCLFRFGGSNGQGNFYVYNSNPTISNVISNQSSNYGMYSNVCASTITNSTFGSNSSNGILFDNSSLAIYGATISNNGSYGLYARGSSHFTVRKSKLTGNTYGIVADGGGSSATLTSLDSSIVSFNTAAGIYCWYGTGPQTFAYNRIEGNGTGYGLWVFNVDNLVTIVGDTIVNHGQEGIITSKASITNNVIQNNRYPIALIGRVNTTYSGNTISGNLYNNALALRLNRYEESLSDTLSATFPAGITSKTYVVIDNASSLAIIPGQTLVVQPGVVIKMDVGAYFRVDGTLIANGTSGSPIVFTSYRDASYGGKTNLASDNAAPAPGDWRYVRIRTAGSNATLLNNVIFKYGGTDNVGNLWIESSVTFSNQITNIISRKSSTMGIRIGDSQLIFNNA
ncbi:MAG: right-handed parallel beta-helix repeat-containing protein, partial [Ignavibacteriales bacterium]|nr:right-handed parallel beta-helix repeat-containing protein [Ignavibacteriales bacterium]